MGRTLRLFACAAAMLVVAVGVAAFFKDEPGYEAGRSEISGKIVGLTEFQESREDHAVSAVADGGRAGESLPSSSSAGGKGSVDADTRQSDRVASASAPFDTRPASIETERSSDAVMAEKAERPEKTKEKVSASAASSVEKEKSDASSGGDEKGAPAKGEKQESPEKQPSDTAPIPATSVGSAETQPAKEAGQKNVASAEAEQNGQTYERVVTSAKFSMQGSQIKLTLQGNAPMVGHYFTLGNPDRVVLDLAGNWEIDVPRVPSNRLIQAVRVGQHDDKTRLVFDMKTTGRAALVPLNRNALELRIQ